MSDFVDMGFTGESPTTCAQVRAQGCGWSLPSVGGGRDTGCQETTSKSTPSRRCSAYGSGPRRPTGDDRLMDTVPTHPDAAPAICPICGEWPTATATRLEGSMATADHRDAAGHIWTTKWLVPA